MPRKAIVRQVPCPECETPQCVWHGQVNRLAWFGCRSCGHTFYAEELTRQECEAEGVPFRYADPREFFVTV